MFLMNSERILQEGVTRLGRPIYLIYRREGMYPAGAISVHREDRWAVVWEIDNGRHGENFDSPTAARAAFDARSRAYELSSKKDA